MIDAAQWGMTGTLIAIQPGVTACLRCAYPEDPPFEEMFPVVGAISLAVGWSLWSLRPWGGKAATTSTGLAPRPAVPTVG
jgi:hypothetical protein